MGGIPPKRGQVLDDDGVSPINGGVVPKIRGLPPPHLQGGPYKSGGGVPRMWGSLCPPPFAVPFCPPPPPGGTPIKEQ